MKREMDLHFPVSGDSVLAQTVRDFGFHYFDQLADYVQKIPYQRNTASDDPLIVLLENKGTCSTKHRLLAAVAQDCGHVEVQLTVGMYAMCEDNTPGVDIVLSATELDYIPEAHCYLTIHGRRYDFTGLSNGSEPVFKRLFAEYPMAPAEVMQRKIILHKQFISTWSQARQKTPGYLWEVREKCIAALSKKDIDIRLRT